mmetsp:Transcript_40320/g.114046  ORF Transcript_40320/g.114046 Transcript_40320/m.114046 type:complete len:299 (+) Transcript_40320:54-950(+)
MGCGAKNQNIRAPLTHSWASLARSEDDVAVLPGVQRAAGLLRRLHREQLLLLLDLLLLLVDHLLHPVELLSRLLVQLLDHVRDDELDPGDHHVLERVDAAARHLDLLVDRREGRLQGRELHEGLDGVLVRLAVVLDHRAAVPDAEGPDGRVLARVVARLELGHGASGDAFRAQLHRDARGAGPPEDRGGEVAARGGPVRLRARERAVLEGAPGLHLDDDDGLHDLRELRLQRVTLLLQQLVALGGADQPGLEDLQVHAVRWRALGWHLAGVVERRSRSVRAGARGRRLRGGLVLGRTA